MARFRIVYIYKHKCDMDWTVFISVHVFINVCVDAFGQ